MLSLDDFTTLLAFTFTWKEKNDDVRCRQDTGKGQIKF